MTDMFAASDYDADVLRAGLVAELTRSGALRSSRWRSAFADVPRHRFVPRFLIDPDHSGRYLTIDGDDPDQQSEWLRQVYRDEPLLTHLVNGEWISSSSQPSLMARMLEALDLSGDEHILEIGTGTGYNTALLCEGLRTDSQVVSVDIDPELTETARDRLADLGYRPTIATVDGAAGHHTAAPYDRIIATCSLPGLPIQWLDQVADGGLIMFNLYRDLGNGAIALLKVTNGQASGHFLPFSGGFMPTRTLSRTTVAELLPSKAEGTDRPTGITADALNDPDFGMAAGLRIDAFRLGLVPEDGPTQTWLLACDGSWACQTIDAAGKPVVAEAGPNRLWTQLESAHSDWAEGGTRRRETYGLTVTPDGAHILWHGSPAGPSWPLTITHDA